MAVPKRKTSPSKRKMRSASNSKLFPVNAVENQTTGEYQRPHHLTKDGYYNGKLVLKPKKVEHDEDDHDHENCDNPNHNHKHKH